MHRLAPQVLFRKRREYIPVGSHKNLPTHLLLRCGQARVVHPWTTRSAESICEQIDMETPPNPCF
jgi:hypothetical protein